jgi:hypothetical protein
MMNRNRKIKVLYDVQVLEEEEGIRRGIFAVVYNILKELMKHPELEVKLYAGPEDHADLRIKQFVTSEANRRNAPELFMVMSRTSIFFYLHPIPFQMREKTGIICDSIIHDLIQYRLVRKYMSQPGLMKICRTFIHETCSLSNRASIAFTYFLNSWHRSLKYALQFLLIHISQNPLQALKKLVLVSQVNPFEFLFDGRKQVQVTSGHIM